MVKAGATLFLFITAMSACTSCLRAQERPGSIRGVVRDREFDVPVAGALVAIAETGEKVETSDQGNFVFRAVPPGRYTLVATKDGYLRQVKADVVVAAGRLVDVDFALPGDITDLDEFVVQDLVTAAPDSEAALLQLRLSSVALIDSVGADLMRQAGASDAAAGLRLVAGASLQDGKSAVIRGLPDRYVSSQLNGMRLPTADEDKRAVELDQFPAAVVERIQVTKTFTPDQQGDASGGAVDVRLRGVPDEPFFFRFDSEISRNSQVAGRHDFLTYRGGGVDFWGFDDGGRDPQLGNLGGNWSGAVGVSRDDAPIDDKWALSIGGSHRLGHGLQIGGSASFFYERDSSFHHGVDDSMWVESPGAPMTPKITQGSVQQGDFKTALFDVTQGKQSVQWGGLATLGARTEHHSIDFVLLYTHTAEDSATLAEDTRGKQFFFPGYDPNDPTTPGHDQPDAAPYLRLETLDYTERTTSSLQLHGRHELLLGGKRPAELEWTAAHSEASADQPDKRQFGSLWQPDRTVGSILIPASHRPYKPADNFNLGNLQRIFKSITERSDQFAVDFQLPFAQWDDEPGYVKAGVFHDHLRRSFDQDTFSNFGDNSSFAAPFETFWSGVFPQENHPITESQFDVDYRGRQDIGGLYAMADLPLLPTLDLIGGARLETTDIDVVNDPESQATWFPPGSLAPTALHPGDADVAFSHDDLLPSLGLVWRPLDGVALRASYSQTVARQTFKELTPIVQQEFLGGPIFIGNPGLRTSAIENWDLRADWAPYDGGLLSVSWFRKDVTDPIEYVQRLATFDFTTAVNYPRGRLTGYEFELRQDAGRFWKPLHGLSIGGNATLIGSEVVLPADEAAGFNLPGIQAPMEQRDMTNAPDHLYNLYLTYTAPFIGTQLGVFYTLQGDTLVAGAGQSEGRLVPNVYMTAFDVLNVSVMQPIGEHLKLRFAAKNLTNPDIREVYRSPYIGADVTRTSHTEGVEYSFGISFAAKF